MRPIFGHRSPVVTRPIVGAGRRQVQTEVVVLNLESGPAYSVPAPSFRIITPSVRLVTLWALTFNPDRQPPQSGPNAWTVSADAYVRGSREQGGTLMRANNIVTDVALPWSLNMPLQGIDAVVGSVTLPYPSGLDSTQLYLTAIWEPAPGDDIPDDELQAIFALCNVQTFPVTVNKTGGV